LSRAALRIGAASCFSLKAAGYKIVAAYHSNDQVAERFNRDTGISVYKRDVASYDACVAGLKRVESEIGPIEILVDNAGSHVTEMFHKITLVHAVKQTQLSLFE